MALKTLKVPFGEMKGLMQAVDDNLLSLSYSPDCQNFTVENGILSTVRGSTKINVEALTGRTIKRIFKFNGVSIGHGLIIGTDDAMSSWKWYYISSSDNKLYEITTTGGTSLTMSPFAANAKQVVIGSTQYMILVDGYQAVKIWQTNTLTGELKYATLEGTPPAGSCITTHRERVWLGKGNTVYYSNAYNPEDWSTPGKTGSITIEGTDGDVITAIDNIFDDVVIFMRNNIWRITGDIPSEYSVEKLYANQGLVQRDGKSTDGNYSFFVGADGIYQYDGVSSKQVITDEIKGYTSNIFGGSPNLTLVLQDRKLYLMESKIATAYYGKHLIYDVVSKKIDVFSMQNVLAVTNSQNLIYYSDGSYIYYLDNTKLLYDTLPIVAYWNAPETDLGYPYAEKTITDLYFNGWGTDNAGNAGGQVKITVYYKGMNGVQKTKEKTVTLSSTRKQHDVRLGITGRLFKFKFENVNGSAINLSGITLVCELAED